MNNIPVFFTAGGTASLILKEIPTRQTAYVLLRTVTDLPVLLGECRDFCAGCGAEAVFVCREGEDVAGLPHAWDTLRLHARKDTLPEDDGIPLTPVTPENDPVFQRLYNRCFAAVPGAATMDRQQLLSLYREGQRAFLAMDGADTPWGIGLLRENELRAIGVAPAFRGRGLSRRLALSLLRLCPGETVELTVVSTNAPALALYDSLGFRVFEKEAAWFSLK